MGKVIISYHKDKWDVVYESGSGKNRHVVHRETFAHKTNEERANAMGLRLEEIRTQLAPVKYVPS